MNSESKNTKFNIMDALIIILVLACICTVIFRALDIKKVTSAEELDEYVVHFKVDNIRSSSLQYFVEGDTVRIKSTNKVLGTLDEIVQHVPAVGAYNDNGEEVFYPSIDKSNDETRYSVYGNITVKGKMTDGGFLLGGERYIAPNSTLAIITEHIETEIKIISIIEK